MKIAVNTRFLIRNQLEGIGWFTFETLKRICIQHPEHEFIFLFDRPFSRDFIFSDNIIPVVINPPARHPILWYIWFEWSIPAALKKHGADFFFSPDGFNSLRSRIPSLMVIHDIAFEHYPSDVPNIYRQFYTYYTPRYAVKSKRIITVSEYTKNDLIKQYKIDPAKIDVAYNGVNTSYKPISDSEKISARKQFTDGCDYFVYVGSLHPRKNILNLLKAFETFRSTSKSEIKLVLAGRKAWGNKDMLDYYNTMEFRKDVIFAGHQDVSNLNRLIGSALALVYVSYFEGFGIPILEAMNCGTPVITSNVSSMPEVAGDAALLVDPFSPQSIAAAMDKIANNHEIREQLILSGNHRKVNFNWDNTATKIWESIEKATQT